MQERASERGCHRRLTRGMVLDEGIHLGSSRRNLACLPVQSAEAVIGDSLSPQDASETFCDLVTL